MLANTTNPLLHFRCKDKEIPYPLSFCPYLFLMFYERLTKKTPIHHVPVPRSNSFYLKNKVCVQLIQLIN